MGSASPDDSFCLKWNDFHTSVTSSFADLRAESDLFDITLVCEGGRNLQAHRIILSACSLVFKRLIKSARNAKEPTILLWDVKASDMEALLNFMYNGEVNVTHAELNSFLDVAEKLKVRGLTTAGEKEKKIQGPSRRKQSNNASEDAGAMSSPNKKPKISHVQGGAKTIKDVGNSSISASDDNASDDGDGQASGDFDASNAESNEDEDTVGGVAMTSVNPLPPPPPHMLAGATLSADVVAAAAAAAAAAGASGSSGVEGSGTGQTGFLAESPAMASVNTAEPVFGSDGARGYACPYCEKIYLTKSRVKRHILDVHETGEYPCPDCNKMFTSQRRLKDHSRSQYCKGKQQLQVPVNTNFMRS